MLTTNLTVFVVRMKYQDRVTLHVLASPYIVWMTLLNFQMLQCVSSDTSYNYCYIW